MSKLKSVKIEEAPNYMIVEDGTVLNAKAETKVKQKDGKVRLMTDKGRKSFNVKDLSAKYFGEAVAETDKKGKGWSKSGEGKAAPKKEGDKSEKETKSDKKKPAKKEGDKSVTGSQHVRNVYDENPERTNKEISDITGVPSARVWSIIKKHVAALEAAKKLDKKEKK